MNRPRLTGRIIGLALLSVVVLIIVFSSYTIVGPGHRGVVVMLGRVEETVLTEGFHLVIPPVLRQVVPLDVRTKKLEVTADAASSDLQAMTINGVLNYHLDPMDVEKLYQEIGQGYEDIVIAPAMQEAIKAATAQFRVEQVIAQRSTIRDAIKQTLTERLAESYIVVDQFALANVDFSAEFDSAIERKQIAEQAALQKQYELQAAVRDVEITLTRADGDKKSAIIAAEGRAEARRLEAQVEAEALRLIAEQLKGNSDLIQYQWAIKLSPSISTVLLPSDQDIILDTGSLIGK